MASNPELESLGLPPIDQVGFVVKSLDAAEQRYGALFGPFRRMDGSVEAALYRGKETDAQLEIMFGQSGELEIEFIEWKGGASPHSEFIKAGHEGMHHLRYRVDDADAWIEKCATIGYKPIWYKQYTEDTVFAYLEREGDPLLIEFLQMPGPYPVDEK
jgi:catechol 2,3-dioxygenase-like lactoylglutathione lyase family enzyme